MWRLWAALASVAGGLLVASALGGAPAWGIYLILALTGVVAAAALISGRHRRDRRRYAYRPPPARRPPPAEFPGDRELIRDLGRIVSRRDALWLSNHDFSVPWRTAQIEPWAALVRFHASGHIPFDPELARAFDELVRSTTAFLDVYDTNTFTDRTLLSDTWRDVGLSTVDVGTLSERELAVFDRRRALLTTHARSAARAYESFLDAAQRALTP